MRAACLAAVLAVLGCERVGSDSPAPPMKAFVDLDWSRIPTDDELVRGMVGTGGTERQRREVERMARSLLVPVFHYSGVSDYESAYREYAKALRSSTGRDPVTAFANVAAEARAWMIHWPLYYVACARAHHELWPDEPIKLARVAEIDPATIDDRARTLRRQYEELRTLVSPRVPEIFGSRPVARTHDGVSAQYFIWQIEDNLRIASGEGYQRSNSDLYTALVRHGIPTTYTPGAE